MGKQVEIVTHVLIEDVAAEGKCIARVDDKIVFVEKTAPGDVVDIRITKKKKKYNEAVPVHFHQYSKLRTAPFCHHFGLCGGCKWQHLNYEAQLQFKERQVKDSLVRIAKVPFPGVYPIVGAEKTSFYRNKLEFTFSNRKWLTYEEVDSGIDLDRNALGFHLPGRFDKVLNIETCYLQEHPSNDIRLKLRDFALANKLEFYDVLEHKGFLRNLLIRTANTGEIMVIVQFAIHDLDRIEIVMNYLVTAFQSVNSFFYVVNTKKNDTFFDQELVNHHGKAFITEKMENLEFRIGPKTFFQTNSAQALKLYSKTREFAYLAGHETVYDLYTGAGTIANFVAAKAKKVIGIEHVPEAIEDALINSSINNIQNTRFVVGDTVNVLNEAFVQEHGRPDVIITDPPRAGMHPDVTSKIIELEPDRIVYVSCNPATQARDVAVMNELYDIMAVQPVDMFPHTTHVENIISLKRKV